MAGGDSGDMWRVSPAVDFGSLPIIALGLAFSFAFYGLVRKKIAVEAQTGMLIETMWLLPVAAIYLFAIADSSTSHMGQNPMSLNLLLIAAGIVTTVPLLCLPPLPRACVSQR